MAAGAQLRLGRLLGRGYVSALSAGERARIQRSLLPGRIEPGRVVAVLVRRQRGLLIWLLGLIVVGFAVDVLAHEVWSSSLDLDLGMRHWLSQNITLPSVDTLRVLLAATAGATGTILGIVLSITLIVFQTTAERYGSARIVSFLLRERVASAVVQLLALSFAYSLWVLVLLEVVSIADPPYFSAATALLMSTAGVLALITFRTQALLGYLPTSITQALTREMVRSVSRARRRGSGRSVQRHAQRIVDEDLRTNTDLLRRLIAEERDVLGVAGVIQAAAELLAHYLVVKRELAADSEWWEREAVRADSPWTRMTEQLASKGLMDPTSQQPNRQWLERRLLAQVSEVVGSDMLVEREVSDAVTAFLLSNLQIAFHTQEFDVCLALLDSLKTIVARDEILTDATLAERMAQVPWLLLNLLDTGIGFSAERVVDAEPWKHQVDRLKLPWLEREEAADIATKIERERAIVRTGVTPREAIIREVSKSFEPKDASIRERLINESYDWLHSVLQRVADANAPTSGVVAKQVLRALLRAVHQELPIRVAEDLPKLLAHAYDIENDPALQADLREDSALLARNLAEARHWDECWRVVHAAAVISALARAKESSPQKQGELAFDMLMSLAQVHGWAELTGEPTHARRLAPYLERRWNDLDALATMVGNERFSTALALSFLAGVKYQRWFQPLLIAVGDLPPHFEHVGEQQIPIEHGKLHGSSLFRDWSFTNDYDEILEHLIESAVTWRATHRMRLLSTLQALLISRERT
jgi:Predicted membrane protein (DUF2254)